LDDEVRLGGDLLRGVGAAAVGYDNLVGLLPAHFAKSLLQAVFFIESRYDDGHGHGAPVAQGKSR
jgi:hypothetical protein